MSFSPERTLIQRLNCSSLKLIYSKLTFLKEKSYNDNEPRQKQGVLVHVYIRRIKPPFLIPLD